MHQRPVSDGSRTNAGALSRSRSSRRPRAGRCRARGSRRGGGCGRRPSAWRTRGGADAEAGDAVDDVHDQPVAVQVVADDHVERAWWWCPPPCSRGHAGWRGRCGGRRGGGSATGSRGRRRSPACRVVNSASYSGSGMPCGCSSVRQQPGHVDDVDDPDGQLGQVPAQQVRRRPAISWVGTSPAQASTTSGSRLPSSVPAHSQMPAPRAQWARASSMVSQSKQGCLPATIDVDVVAAAQGVIGHGQQGVGVRRQVDPYDLGALVEDVVDEAGVLVREAVVVLPPDVRGEQVVQGGDGAPPGQSARGLEPLDVLVDHRVDDVRRTPRSRRTARAGR